MFGNLLNSFYSTIMRNERKSKSAVPRDMQKKESTKPEKKVTVSPGLSEVEIIEHAFGKFYEGKIIQTDLRTLLNLVPRKRERSDAYKTLIKELKEAYGVSLQIVPRWKLNNQNEEENESMD